MSYSPHTLEPDGLVVEDADGNRLLAVPTVAVELLDSAYVLQYTRGGVTQRFQLGRPGGQLAVVPVQPDLPPTPAAAVQCSECRAVAENGDPQGLGCVWCGAPLTARR